MAIGKGESSPGNPFECDHDEDDESPSSSSAASSTTPASPVPYFPFIRIPILIVCTVIVFVLLIAGTATTVISYPPIPKTQRNSNQNFSNTDTVLDGDYKLLGPLLLTSGCFLLVVEIILCIIITREAYSVSRTIRPSVQDINDLRPVPVSFVGGPFYIATTDPLLANPPFMPFHYTTPRWVQPNAPNPDTPPEGADRKVSSRIRSTTATLSRGRQPAFNHNSSIPISGA